VVVEPDGQGGPHVFVADIDHPQLDDDDRHHLERVLRLRPGDQLTLGDGVGRWRSARFGAELTDLGTPVVVPAEPVELTVGLALVKGSRPELVVQKLTELGIDHIALFVAERSVVRWDESKIEVQRGRLGRIAREAAMQCRRVWMPTLEILADLGRLAARPGVALAHFDGEPVGPDHRGVLIGPEGGFTESELAMSADHVSLGRHVQRAETAALSAGVLLADRRQMTNG